MKDELLILKGHEVLFLLKGQEERIVRVVRQAYKAHARGQSSLPHSNFLRFPNNSSNRIIALPAYLGEDFDLAGIKWVSSFPGNPARGMDRASAVVILSSAETGRPRAIIEGSIISAKRTAASAFLAAQALRNGRQNSCVGMVGTGLINFEILRFLLTARPAPTNFLIYDIDSSHASQFKDKCLETFAHIEMQIAGSVSQVLEKSSLISFATTAALPYVPNLSACALGTLILHVSLRDLSTAAILSADNIVDDIDHICRAQTSIHLTEQLVGHREFIRGTLGEILLGAAPFRKNAETTLIFSPFGLGVLDLALGKLVYDLAVQQGLGLNIESFLPDSWVERT